LLARELSTKEKNVLVIHQARLSGSVERNTVSIPLKTSYGWSKQRIIATTEYASLA